jgi:hypothetical protein
MACDPILGVPTNEAVHFPVAALESGHCSFGNIMLIARQKKKVKARDERGLAVCGRELCRTEFVRDSKAGLSLSIPL